MINIITSFTNFITQYIVIISDLEKKRNDSNCDHSQLPEFVTTHTASLGILHLVQRVLWLSSV